MEDGFVVGKGRSKPVPGPLAIHAYDIEWILFRTVKQYKPHSFSLLAYITFKRAYTVSVNIRKSFAQ